MSRARPYEFDGEKYWFDMRAKATASQLELLSDIEGIEIDDLLDEGLSQRQVLFRLHQADGLVPEEVLVRRRDRLAMAAREPACRICALEGWECEGRITRHHFVPRWLMRELVNYESYAARSLCTIPICVGRHRDLHERGEDPKSIVAYLREHERLFAQKLLDQVKAQRPKIFELMLGGDETYEYQLIRDYTLGLFLIAEQPYELEEYLPLAEAA